MRSTPRRVIAAVAVAAGMSVGAGAARAAVPIYSFETLYNNAGSPDPLGTRPDGYFAVGGGTAVAQDTIGATDGPHSLRFSMVAPATFSGARTAIIPAVINDRATFALVCDVTIPETGGFTGAGFARLGITEFGNNESQGVLGGSAQTTSDAEASIALAPGTYHVTVPLVARGNPITFDANVPFWSIFGSDPDTQLTPSEFQYYINKSGTSAILVYIDNVRVAKSGDVNGNGKIDADDYAIMDWGSHTTFPSDSPPGWMHGDLNLDGQVNSGDYLIIDTALAGQNGGKLSPGLLSERRVEFGDGYVQSLVAAVPEPGSAGVMGLGLAWVGSRRRREG